MNRSSGILLHIASLPSPYGIGNFGREARAFVDFLKKAGQHWWQLLPLTPTGYGDSPYQSVSTFAGNPYFIDPDRLVQNGWLHPSDLPAKQHDDPSQTDYARLYGERAQMLHAAYAGFCRQIPADFDAFCAENSVWLDEYALFMALKSKFDGKPWYEWPTELRLHRPAACKKYAALLHDELRYYRFVQYEFFAQWRELRAYARENGVRILGDIPIYVPLDSADVWSHPENFLLTRTRRSRFIAGCPPDGFNPDGQYWGHPIYDWEKLERDGFSWWLDRVGASAKLFDAIRIDHFRGISSYWRIPAAHKTARHGVWVEGPGMKLIEAINKAFPDTEFIAEDLGFLTPDVYRLLESSGWPGMKVLQFAFDPPGPSCYLPHLYGENCICYTGTHDNDTLHGYCASRNAAQDGYLRSYFGITPADSAEQTLLEAGAASKAMRFFTQMQDWLGLGSEARMNEPGVFKQQNWRWRMLPGSCTDTLAERIRALTEKANRI